MPNKTCPGYGYWVGCKCNDCQELQAKSDASRRQDIENYFVAIGLKTRTPRTPAMTPEEAEEFLKKFLEEVH